MQSQAPDARFEWRKYGFIDPFAMYTTAMLRAESKSRLAGKFRFFFFCFFLRSSRAHHRRCLNV